jgi:hypothetical protein
VPSYTTTPRSAYKSNIRTRTLRFLVEEKSKFGNERIRFRQRLNAHLKLYSPQVLNWFCDISSQIAEHFLERWPTLEAVQKAKTKTLERFFADHNSRSSEKIKARVDEIRHAITATHDDAVMTVSSPAGFCDRQGSLPYQIPLF